MKASTQWRSTSLLLKLSLTCILLPASILPALMSLYLVTQRPDSPDPGSGRTYEVAVSRNATRYLEYDEMERFERTRTIGLVLKIVCLASLGAIFFYERVWRRPAPRLQTNLRN